MSYMNFFEIYCFSIFFCFLVLLIRDFINEPYITFGDIFGMMLCSITPGLNTLVSIWVPFFELFEKYKYVVLWRKK